MKIKLARKQEITMMLDICETMAGALRAITNYPYPVKDVFPNKEELQEFIRNKSLYIYIDKAQILGGVVLTHASLPAYASCNWLIQAPETETLIIRHVLLEPKYRGTVVEWELMRYVISYAKQNNLLSVRYHIYENNLPSICLCEDCGFHLVGSIDLGFQSYGMHLFQVYELLI